MHVFDPLSHFFNCPRVHTDVTGHISTTHCYMFSSESDLKLHVKIERSCPKTRSPEITFKLWVIFYILPKFSEIWPTSGWNFLANFLSTISLHCGA